MKSTLIILVFVAIATMLQAQDATQAVSIRPVKQVGADSTKWFAEMVFVVYLPAKDSSEVVTFIENVEIEKVRKLNAQKEALKKQQEQIDSAIVAIESKGKQVTESFPDSLIAKVTGTWSLVFAKVVTDVKLAINGVIEDSAKKTIGKWKLIAKNRILIITDDYEANLEYNDKTKEWNSVDKIKVKLIKSKNK